MRSAGKKIYTWNFVSFSVSFSSKKDKTKPRITMSDTRRQSILDIARETGVVTVDNLLERFDVTPQTIRKDLNRLCDERFH